MDVLFIMMEKIQEGFREERMKLAVQYGYKISKDWDEKQEAPGSEVRQVEIQRIRKTKSRCDYSSAWRRLVMVELPRSV